MCFFFDYLFIYLPVFVFLISGDNRDEKERNSAVKAQIQQELRRLEDEISACEWTHVNKDP